MNVDDIAESSNAASAAAFVPLAQQHAACAQSDIFAEARNLGLRTMLGCPFAGMDITVRKGQLTAIRGRNGSGKTAFLLTLAGRMAHTEGSLTILGELMPKNRGHIQRHTGLGLFEGVNDLQKSLTVGSVTAAEFELYGRRAKREDVAAYLQSWGFNGLERVRVKDLSRENLVLLGVALGMVNNPEGIAVDDVEDQLTRRQSVRLMEKLAALAHERHVAVMVGCTERDVAALADSVCHLS